MIKKTSLFAALLFALATMGLARAGAAPAAAPEKDAFVTVFGQKIHYVEQGQGPVVILLHGLGDDVSIWQDTIKALSTKYRVIAYDSLGQGKSDKPLIAYRVGTYVDFLDGFMQALHIDHAAIMGNSLGGWVAIDFAAAYPQKVDRLVLIDAAGYKSWPTPEIGNALHLSTRADLKKLIPLTFTDKSLMSDTSIDQMYADTIASGDGFTLLQLMDSAARGEDAIDDVVKNITAPTLVV